MGRVYAPVRVNGRELWALFDTGARNSYVVEGETAGLNVQRLAVPHRAGLGGTQRIFDRVATFQGFVEGKPITLTTFVTGELGADETGRPIDLLVGALAMQNWGIRVVPDEERLDLSHYPTEFIEY